MIDLKKDKDTDDDATFAGETSDEATEASAELEQPYRAPIDLPEKPSRLAEMPDGPGHRADRLVGENDKKLIVGRDIVLNGKISALDRLVVEGTLEAKLKECREIEVGETGNFKGQAEFERADIAGIFEGDLAVSDHLMVRATGRIDGKVSYGELEIERGGQIIGDLQPFVEGAQANGKGAAAGRKKAPVAKAKRTPAKSTPAK